VSFLELFSSQAGSMRQKYNAGAPIDVPSGERADELVEGIVTPDVFANFDDSFARLPECGGMDGAGLVIEQLRRRQDGHRRRDCLQREMKPGSDPPGGARCFIQAFNAAQTASRWPGEMAASGSIFPPPSLHDARGFDADRRRQWRRLSVRRRGVDDQRRVVPTAS
jgi:hypothetical protein